MCTDEEKCKIAKLLQGIEVPDVKISERGMGLVKDFTKRFGSEVEADEMETQEYENPYVPDKQLLEENERKLKELLSVSKRSKRAVSGNVAEAVTDPKRPWRTHSCKEKLLRIEGELKRHSERGTEAISPLAEGDMQLLVEECRAESREPLPAAWLRDTVEEARRRLPNFQYKNLENSTATAILPEAHVSTEAPMQDVIMSEE